jgi:hypothetical protein
MKKLLLLLALLLFVPSALAAEDFTGKWTGSFVGVGPDGQEHTETIFMDLVHKGAALSGTAGPSIERQWKISDGKVDGNKLSFVVNADADHPMKATINLAFAEGHLNGEFQAEADGMKLVAKVDATRVK